MRREQKVGIGVAKARCLFWPSCIALQQETLQHRLGKQSNLSETRNSRLIFEKPVMPFTVILEILGGSRLTAETLCDLE